MSARRRLVVAGVLVCAAAGCRPGTPIREVVRPSAPHEQYVASLHEARLHETALGREWLDAGQRAIREPLSVSLPFREAGYLPPHEPAAVGYRIDLRRGQTLIVDVRIESADAARLFIDAFALNSEGEPERVAYAEDGSLSLTIQPGRDGPYIVRLQPEMLRGGRYEVVQRVNASLGFPVQGFDSRAVASHFGAPREGGARDHHGIDIFAPRGTPVVAAADGWVSAVQTTPRGGHVVWVRNPSAGHSHYYAHLEEQLVSTGQRVRAGDPLGTVGNTGNAQTTPPHLHFGIYARSEGPLDPLPFVHEPRVTPPATTADADALGTWRRTRGARYRLRAGSSTDAPILAELPRHTVVRLDAATGDWYEWRCPTARAVSSSRGRRSRSLRPSGATSQPLPRSCACIPGRALPPSPTSNPAPACLCWVCMRGTCS